MIDIERVKSCLIAITGLDSAVVDEKEELVENAVSYVESITTESAGDDEPRLIMLAAARANYYFALLDSDGGGISSFKAGDVSFTKSDDSTVESARRFYESALGAVSDLVRQDGFVFRTV